MSASTSSTVASQGPSRRGPIVAWSLAGLCLLITSFSLPFVEAGKFGRANQGHLFSGVHQLWTQGHSALALIVSFCGMLAPLLLLLAAPILSQARMNSRQPTQLQRLHLHLHAWAMPDVRLLAILVAFLKLSSLVEASPAAGLWCYAGAAFCTVMLTRELTPPQPHPARLSRPLRLQLSAALGLAAAFLLIPAYLLPVMSFDTIGNHHADSIISSVAKLAHAHQWGLALIIFTASLLVPVLKLVGILTLLVAAHRRRRSASPALQKLHAIVHGVGRWSMLDVFLIAFLAGIVDFGSLGSVQARPGALAFAMAVILTMLSTANLEESDFEPITFSAHEHR